MKKLYLLVLAVILIAGCTQKTETPNGSASGGEIDIESVDDLIFTKDESTLFSSSDWTASEIKTYDTEHSTARTLVINSAEGLPFTQIEIMASHLENEKVARRVFDRKKMGTIETAGLGLAGFECVGNTEHFETVGSSTEFDCLSGGYTIYAYVKSDTDNSEVYLKEVLDTIERKIT